MAEQHYLFDWGDTLMVDLANQTGAMCDWPQIKCVPDALDCLTRLSQIAFCHLATNARDSSPEQIRLALQRAGLSQYLNKIFCYKTLGCDKSHPAFYTQIVASLQVKPTQITMVGDSLAKDIYPALNQGLQAIWFNPQRLPCAENIESIQSLVELPLR